MLAVLRRRNFLLLWLGGLVSNAGDWALAIALPVLVYDLTGSTLATGGVFLAQSLPRLSLGLFAGILVDRWERRRIMITADLGRCAIMPLLLLLQSADTLPVLYVVVAVEAILGLFFVPAHAAFLPHVVHDQGLVAANGLRALGWEITRLAAPPVGGLIMATHGFSAVVLLNSVSYLLSAALLLAIVVPGKRFKKTSHRPVPDDGFWKGVRHDVLTGLRTVARSRPLWVLFLLGGLGFVGEGIINVLSFPWLASELGGGAAERGWLATAQAVGGIMGGMVVRKVADAIAPVAAISVSAMLFGILSLLLANITVLPVAETNRWLVSLVLKGLSGLPLIVLIVSLDTLLVHYTDDRLRGRVLATYGVLTGAALVIGQILAGVLGEPFGVVPVLSLQGALYATAGLAAIILLPRGMRWRVVTAPADVTAPKKVVKES